MFIDNAISDYLKDIDDHIYTKEEIEDMVDKIIKDAQLDDYYNGIRFTTDNNDDMGSYNFLSKIIKIYYEHVIWIAEDDFDELGLTKNRNAFINLSILETLFHEITHVIQNFIITESDWPLAPLLRLDVLYFNEHIVSDEDYTRYHDYFLYERDANATALEHLLYIIRRYVKDDEIFECFKERLHSFMVEGYSKDGDIVTSPIEFIFKNLYKLDVPCVQNMDLYDRMKLGFIVSKEEYDRYINNRNRIILAKLS